MFHCTVHTSTRRRDNHASELQFSRPVNVQPQLGESESGRPTPGASSEEKFSDPGWPTTPTKPLESPNCSGAEQSPTRAWVAPETESERPAST